MRSIDAVAMSRDGVPLAFTVGGTDEPAVVLIHGWSCDRSMWGAIAASPADRRRVVSLDLAGHGDSRARVDARPWSIAAFAADVEDVVAACGARDVILVGHSMGGPVALEAALRLGARVRAVIGVDTFNEATFYRARPEAEIARRCATFVGDFHGTMRAMIGHITAPGTAPALVDRIATTMERTDPAVAGAALAALLRWDIDERWPLLHVPVETINSAIAARTNETIALDGLRVHELAGVGHFPMLERPAAFWATVRGIVDRYADPTTLA